MALIQVKEVVRSGLIQRVTRFVSPPNPSGPSSCLWKSDSFSKQKRALMMARMMEYRTSFFSSDFSTTQVVSPAASAELHTCAAARQEAESSSEESQKSSVNSAGASSSSEADSVLLDRSYGEEQGDHCKVAEGAHEHFESTKDEGESESLESTGFDMSKKSRPSGDE